MALVLPQVPWGKGTRPGSWVWSSAGTGHHPGQLATPAGCALPVPPMMLWPCWLVSQTFLPRSRLLHLPFLLPGWGLPAPHHSLQLKFYSSERPAPATCPPGPPLPLYHSTQFLPILHHFVCLLFCSACFLLVSPQKSRCQTSLIPC